MVVTGFLCVAIGVYPAMLYNILPHQEAVGEYVPYALEHVLEAAVVLGLAALFFFTIGARVLAPKSSHEIPDLDVAYNASGRGVQAGCSLVSRGFGWVYDRVSTTGSLLISFGRRSMKVEGRDVNWNLVAFALVIALLLGAALVGVT